MKLREKLMKSVLLGASLMVWTACAPAAEPTIPKNVATDSRRIQEIDDLEEILNHAEQRASPEGREVLQKGREMVKDKVVIVGSCWDFINGVYDRSGYTEKKRLSYFKSKKAGPYADVNEFQPGDWLYYVNHSFGDVEHSGVFVEWTDFAVREALILSYAGGNQSLPGRYKTYDLTNTYYIIRPKAK